MTGEASIRTATALDVAVGEVLCEGEGIASNEEEGEEEGEGWSVAEGVAVVDRTDGGGAWCAGNVGDRWATEVEEGKEEWMGGCSWQPERELASVVEVVASTGEGGTASVSIIDCKTSPLSG
jgi:hypothetical protein